MTNLHTKEPWHYTPARSSGFAILNRHGDGVVQTDEYGHVGGVRLEADAKRIIARVKACKGVDTKALEKMPTSFGELLSLEFKEVVAQRDQLLAALEEVVRISDRKHDAWDRAKTAIASVSGNATTQPDLSHIEEFTVQWFESRQKWIAIFPNGHVIDDGFGAVGYAISAAYQYLNRGEVEFECTEDTGSYQRYEKDEEYWGINDEGGAS